MLRISPAMCFRQGKEEECSNAFLGDNARNLRGRSNVFAGIPTTISVNSPKASFRGIYNATPGDDRKGFWVPTKKFRSGSPGLAAPGFRCICNSFSELQGVYRVVAAWHL